jgi:uncharacterized membrane protein YcaP (DUF421 family)
MHRNGLSRELIFSKLRGSGIKNLGTVQRLYYEPSGGYCLHTFQTMEPGLCLIPDWDLAFQNIQTYAKDTWSYNDCGLTRLGTLVQNENKTCSNCGNGNWKAAVITN